VQALVDAIEDSGARLSGTAMRQVGA